MRTQRLSFTDVDASAYSSQVIVQLSKHLPPGTTRGSRGHASYPWHRHPGRQRLERSFRASLTAEMT
jgi:hypothetical protein